MRNFVPELVNKAKAYYLRYLGRRDEYSVQITLTLTLPLIDDVYAREFRHFQSSDLSEDMHQHAAMKLLLVLRRGVVPYHKYMEFLYTVVKNSMWDAVREHLRGKEPPEDWEPPVQKVKGTKNLEDREFILGLPERLIKEVKEYLDNRVMCKAYKLATIEACNRILAKKKLSKFHMKEFVRGKQDKMFPIYLANVLIKKILYRIRETECPLEDVSSLDGILVGKYEYEEQLYDNQ